MLKGSRLKRDLKEQTSSLSRNATSVQSLQKSCHVHYDERMSTRPMPDQRCLVVGVFDVRFRALRKLDPIHGEPKLKNKDMTSRNKQTDHWFQQVCTIQSHELHTSGRIMCVLVVISESNSSDVLGSLRSAQDKQRCRGVCPSSTYPMQNVVPTSLLRFGPH